MKRINNWETFNELKRSTYMSAADKLDDLGRKTTAKKMRNHADNFGHDLWIKNRTKKHENDVFKMYDNGNIMEYRFLGLSIDMMIDIWRSSEKEDIYNVAIFECLSCDTPRTMDMYILKQDNEYVVDVIPQNDEDFAAFGFMNRPDAKRFLSLLKQSVIEDVAEFGKDYKGDDLKEFKSLLLDLCNPPIGLLIKD